MPATTASWFLCAAIHCPNTDAPAPKPTNTVVKPSTKNTEASTTRRHRCASMPSLLPICSMVGAAEIAEVGRHQRQHARRQEAHEARQRDAEVDVDLREHGGLCLGDRPFQIELRGAQARRSALSCRRARTGRCWRPEPTPPGAALEVGRHHVPDRRTLRVLVDRGPTRHDVVLVGLDGRRRSRSRCMLPMRSPSSASTLTVKPMPPTRTMSPPCCR